MLRRVASFLLLAVLLAAGAATGAQNRQEKIDVDTIGRIKEEGLKRSQIMEILSYLTDVHGPRLTGSPNYKAASDWAMQRLRQWGLQNAHLEAWGPFGRGWSLEAFSASVTHPHFFPVIAYPKAWSPGTNGPVRGELVYFDAGTDAELEKFNGKLKGAIVLIAAPRELTAHFKPEGGRFSDEELLKLANEEREQRRRQMTPEQRAAAQLVQKKYFMCSSEGAAVILEPGRGDGGTIFIGSATVPQASSGDSESSDGPPDRRVRPWAKDVTGVTPQAVVAAEHYNRIIRMLSKGVKVQMEVSIAARFHDQDLMGYNVIAEIPGSDLRDEVVMLGAHFDSWHSGTGATDNAAGSAVCLEAVRVLQALGLKPRRTIRIGLWGGEEQGLLGSRAYVAKHFAERIGGEQPGPRAQEGRSQGPVTIEPRPDYSKFSAYFNLDNGTGKVRGVYMQGNELVRPIFRAWLAPFRDMGAGTLTSLNTSGTDHLSFDAVGLPGFQFIQDPVEYSTRTHHSNMDVYDRIQEDDMKQAAVIMASFVYNAAMRDEKIPRKPGAVQTQARAGQ